MNGQALVDLLVSILDNESIDETFALQMINVARGYIEDRQPLIVFKTLDKTQTVASGNNATMGIPLPSKFRMFAPTRGEEGGSVQLYNGSNYVQDLFESQFEEQLRNMNYFGKYYVDYGQGLLYILGTVPGNYTLYQFYIMDPGDITLTTQWGQIGSRVAMPAKYHPMLAYEAAAMWRLGTDYDNTAARNAEDNAKRSDLIYKGMLKWNTGVALSQIGNKDYGGYGNFDRGLRSGTGPRG